MLERIKLLVNKLNEASKAYYDKDEERISNKEFDELYDELVNLEELTGIVLSNSPTQKVGYEVLSNLPKIQHPSKMLSLDKTKDVEKLKEWLENKEGLISWKLDGLTVVITYREGSLVQAVTRGNGEIGELITNNAKVFKNLPLKIKYKGELVIRGEAIIKYSDFEKINEQLPIEEQYKNPRNLCSGSVRQLNNKITSSRNVNFYAFSLVEAQDIDFNNKRSEQYEWLQSLGFETVEYEKVISETLDEKVNLFKEKVKHYEIPSDGLVLTYNDIKYSESLGSTAKFPRHSIAFKWSDEIKQTKLLRVEWNTSRTGLINPIAVFEPVELEGTTVKQASIHNVSILEELELGEGDIIQVYKANMIIPQVADNLTRSNNIIIPNKCPACIEDTEIKQIKDTKVLYCKNPNCPAKLLKSIVHYVSRDAMNIEGLSEATIKKLIDKSWVKDFSDIYNLEQYKEEIVNMDGFGEKSYENLINAIEKSKKVKLPNFIYALGINNVGLSNAKLLCKFYKNNIEGIINLKKEELLEIEGFGEIIANSIISYFNYEQNIDLINKVLLYIKIEKQNANISDFLAEKTFVITGSLDQFKNRDELKEKIESLGGKVTNTVTKNTNYLINNDNTSNSSKNKKAKELEVTIITEDEFINMIK